MKYVGEAVAKNIYDKNRIILLGIANWCTITYNDTLVKNKDSIDSDTNPVVYELVKPVSQKSKLSEFLNPDHSHFILVDNAQEKYGGEIEFRVKLESEIAKGDGTTRPIPVVVVVIGGGPNSVTCVLESVKLGTPCLFIDVLFYIRFKLF